MPDLTIRPGHPDFLDLPWDTSLDDWEHPRLVDLPKGISRHTVRFVSYDQGIYAVKELSERAAEQDYTVLRTLEPTGVPSVVAVGLITNRHPDRHAQESAALITKYEQFSFSYRELLEGAGFGELRDKMLDAVAGLLVELHLAGCFWGDCSLSNVLYRWDASSIQTIMVDGETASIHDELTKGQREEDLGIMEINVAGGMADIAAGHGFEIDEADLGLGEDIAARYRGLWYELKRDESIGADERYKITERINRLNTLGFAIDEVDVVESEEGNLLKIHVRIGGRSFHRERLRDLTGVEALENQASQILTDLYHYQAESTTTTTSLKALSAVKWRMSVLEPALARLRKTDGVTDPIQAYCDLLHHRYVKSSEFGRDVGNESAFASWIADGMPGYPADVSVNVTADDT